MLNTVSPILVSLSLHYYFNTIINIKLYLSVVVVERLLPTPEDLELNLTMRNCSKRKIILLLIEKTKTTRLDWPILLFDHRD